jgi:RimJ/RimL family protein N-acetyltransferase
MDVPTLKGPDDGDVRLLLRPRTGADGDPGIELCRGTVLAGRDEGSELMFAVDAECADDGGPGVLRYAGSLALRPLPGGGLAVDFALSPWAQGRGVMSDALRTALRWAFDELGTQVVHWTAPVDGWASRRVAWACGFRVEATVRGLLEAGDVRYDGWVGTLVRGEPMTPAHPWLEAPVVVGEQVVLRPWREQDAPRVVEACSDPASRRWLPNLPSPYALADAQWYIRTREEEHAQGSGVYWCVADSRDDRCLGSIGLMGLGAPSLRNEMGYWAHPDARGRGVMTEAARLALRHAVVPVLDGGLGLDRVTLRAATGNVASNRVAQRAGFTRVGLSRHVDARPDGTFDDLALYDALPDEVLG